MRFLILATLACAATIPLPLLAQSGDKPNTSAGYSYAIVVAEETLADKNWKAVVETLVEKHQGQVLTYEGKVSESTSALRELHPHYTCFVAKHADCGREFVASVHQLTRTLDDDPYTDTFWGILTGYDAKNALRIARTTKPLTVRKVASGTEVALEKCEAGIWYCELEKNRVVRKKTGGAIELLRGPSDTTKALVDTLNEFQADLFVTSGHATERDWQIGFRYRNGQFRSDDGQLFGLDTSGKKHPVQSDNPKVYMPIGNCLMGHIDGRDAMALAFMNSAGVTQMLGYTQVTWYGYGGWGCLDYFVEQPGRYSFVEAFFANHHALIHRLENNLPDRRGLEFDRDIVAMYGDPAWESRMTDGTKSWEQTLTEKAGVFTLEITPNLGDQTFEPVNKNGAQRGYRPIVAFLPRRISGAKIISGGGLNPVVTDDFVLIPLPQKFDADREYQIVFEEISE